MFTTGLAATIAVAVFVASPATSSSEPPDTLTDCPSSGSGLPPGGLPDIPLAASIAPSDNSTSVALNVDAAAQIQCGRTTVTTHTDVVYATPTLADGSPVPLRLDVIVPDSPGPHPLVIFIPGGGFVMANKAGSLPQRTYLAEAGFTVAAIEYRTVLSEATYVEGVSDVKSAIRFLRARAGDYNIDPASVAVWGESAGGYIAAMVGATNGDPQFEAGDDLDQSSDVQAAVDMFGASDLSLTMSDFDDAMQAFWAAPGTPAAQWVNGIGTELSILDDPAAVAMANPVTFVDATDPPFLLFHGDADVLISPSQTLLMHTALLDAGVPSSRYVVEGGGHGDLAVLTDPDGPMDWTTTSVVNVIRDFLVGSLDG